MTQRTSSLSASGIISASRPGGTGRRRTGGSSERTSRGLTVRNKDWIDVLLGPVPCQGCGNPVVWVRWDGKYRFWADPGADIPHLCASPPVAQDAPLEPPPEALHRITERWKEAMNGQG